MLEKRRTRQTSLIDGYFISIENLSQPNNCGVGRSIKIETVARIYRPEVSRYSTESKDCILILIPIGLDYWTDTKNRLLVLIHATRFFVLEMERVWFVDFSIWSCKIDCKWGINRPSTSQVVGEARSLYNLSSLYMQDTFSSVV